MAFQLKQVILKEFKTHALKSIFWRTSFVVFQHSAYNVIKKKFSRKYGLVLEIFRVLY